MSFDCSRFPFQPWKDYSGVAQQQGRVQLDSDWNEWLAELTRRIQAGSLDTFGRAVVPSTTPDAFHVVPTSSHGITIGTGRMYVDGLLAENHGLPAQRVKWDSALAEMSAAPAAPPLPAAAPLDFSQQPYLPGPVPPTTNGPFVAYLDVWQRPVTYLQDPDLIEKAVGVDTTARLQTAWQVNLLDISGVRGASNVTCSTTLSAWDALIQPSAAQLTTDVAQFSTPGPCCLTPSTGYTGMENQLYRVEIHQAGVASAGAGAFAQGTATFKFSRDNASVATAVTAITMVTGTSGQSSQLSVESTGRDDVLNFKPGDWIEITDDYLELRGQPGELHKIDLNGVDKVGKTITLVGTVSSLLQGRLTNPPSNYPNCHTRICRWDQGGKVYQSDGTTVWFDLDAAASTGDIPVPPPGTTLVLENGITVAFALSSSLSGSFKPCDFWAFAARASDGSVEHLTNAPPMGPHHHYAKLAVITFPNKALDCRIPWPPAQGAAGESCACTICVDVADYNKDRTAIASAIAKVDAAGGGRVCLGPGAFVFGSTSLTIKALANSVILSGQGAATLLLFYGNGAAIDVQGCLKGLRIEDLGIVAIAQNPFVAQGPIAIQNQTNGIARLEGTTATNGGTAATNGGTAATSGATPVAIGIRMQNSALITVSRCGILALSASEFKFAAAPSTVTESIALVQGNVNFDTEAISKVDSLETLLKNYSLSPGALAIALDGFLVEIQLRDNFLVADAGIGKTSLLAAAAGGTSVAGITVASDWLAVVDLKITNNLAVCAMAGIAIVDLTGADARTYFGAEIGIEGNRIFDCAGTGILIAGVASAISDAAVRIAGNHVEVPGSGIVCATDMAAIEDNFITQAQTTPPASGPSAPPLGIMVISAASDAPLITNTRVIRNRLHMLKGAGVIITGNVALSSILENSISAVTSAGIVISGNQASFEAIIRNNEIVVVSAPASTAGSVNAQAKVLNTLETLNTAGVAAPPPPTVFGIWVSTIPNATIQNNTIAALGTLGTPAVATAIALPQSVQRATISGNDISEIGESNQACTGIAVGTGFADLGISGNSIVQTSTNADSAPSFVGISIAASESKTASTVSVDNNAVSANSRSSLIDIKVAAAPGHCILTANRCTQSYQKAPVIVSASGHSVIAANNRIVCSGEARECLSIWGGNVQVAPTQVTVLGNIADGHIRLGGNILGDPWKPLNVST